MLQQWRGGLTQAAVSIGFCWVAGDSVTRHEEPSKYEVTREDLLTLAGMVESVQDEVVAEWLPEAVSTMREGGWTDTDSAELEAEARYLLSRLPERLRSDPVAVQTDTEKRAFRFLGRHVLWEEGDSMRTVSLRYLHSSLTLRLWLAILSLLSAHCSSSLALEGRGTLASTVECATGWLTGTGDSPG